MESCPSCGRENLQPGASYCLYCGAPLHATATPRVVAPASPDRYDRAIERVERLGTLVAILSAIALVLVLV